MSKTRRTRSHRLTSSPTSASTDSVTTSWSTSASVPTATSPTKRWCSGTTPISRTTSGPRDPLLNMAMNYCGGVVPDGARRRTVARGRGRHVRGMSDSLTRLDFASGFGSVWELIRATNAYIEDSKPWELNKQGDADAVAAVLGDCLESLRIVALLASPVIPNAAAELWRRLGLAAGPKTSVCRPRPDGDSCPRAPAREGRPLFPRKET